MCKERKAPEWESAMHIVAFPKSRGNTTLPEVRILGMKLQSSLSLHVSDSHPNGSIKGSVFSLLQPCKKCSVLFYHMSAALH